MRCYICDWSPTGTESFFHETLELNNFQLFRNELHLGQHARPLGYHSGKPRLLFDDKERPICSRCALHGQAQDPAHSETFLEPEDLEEELPAEVDELEPVS